MVCRHQMSHRICDWIWSYLRKLYGPRAEAKLQDYRGGDTSTSKHYSKKMSSGRIPQIRTNTRRGMDTRQYPRSSWSGFTDPTCKARRRRQAFSGRGSTPSIGGAHALFAMSRPFPRRPTSTSIRGIGGSSLRGHP